MSKTKLHTKYETREAWLIAAIAAMTPWFESKNYKVPSLRVACGWPVTGGMAARKRRIGECWSKESATDKTCQIFISPWLIDVTAEGGVLATLVHEVVHAVVGNKEGHNKVFGKCARAVGLVGKLTSTTAGPELLKGIADWAKELGEYPHARLDLFKSPVKKQTTRMVKCECSDCGYTVRTSRKWLEEAGAPLCPCNKKSMGFEIPDELESDDDGDSEGCAANHSDGPLPPKWKHTKRFDLSQIKHYIDQRARAEQMALRIAQKARAEAEKMGTIVAEIHDEIIVEGLRETR